MARSVFLCGVLGALALVACGSSGDKKAGLPQFDANTGVPGNYADDGLGAPNSGTFLAADRRIAWNPGIPGGIPEYTTICATVDAATYGDGKTEAHQAIQDAIDACPEGQVVKVPEGTYRLTDSIVINKGIVLRGDGPGKTHLYMDRDPNDSTRVIRLGEWGPLADSSTGIAITGDYQLGATSITVADATSFKVGDIVIIDELDDPDITLKHNCVFFKRVDSDGNRSIGQTLEITAIAGNTITFATPLYYKFIQTLKPQIYAQSNTYIGTVKNAGIEDLYVGHGGGENILISYAAYSWVKNVESADVLGHHISVSSSYRCVIRDNYVHHAETYSPGGGSYGISVQSLSSDNLVENNIVYYMNLPLALIASGGGNVIAYNYADGSITGNQTNWQSGDLTSHCAFPHMELIEGNWLQAVNGDNVWDGGGYLTYFRNRINGLHENLKDPDGNPVTIEGGIVSLNLEANNLYMNSVGNVLWREAATGQYEGCQDPVVYRLGGWAGPKDSGDNGPCTIDDRVEATIFRHGNFDYVNNTVLWDATNTDHTLPNSLYRSAKPAFLGAHRWPFVESDGNPMIDMIPAKERYDAEFAAQN